MQQPTFFENEIVQPQNLNFLNTSVTKNITDLVTTMSGGKPGIVAGLTLTGVSGNNYYTVSPGYGYTGAGEYVQVYSGTNVNIAFTGSQNIYLNFTSAVYNPDPTINPQGASNVVTNTNPTDNTQVAVESYNFPVISNISGNGFIPLGTVTANSSMLFLTANASGSQDFQIGGTIDIRNQTIQGVNIASGTIDSNIFTPQLHYGITLATGVGIALAGSGTSSIGSVASPLANIASLTGLFHQLVGFSPIIIDGMIQMTGTSLEASGNNLVLIDTKAQGTRFGNALTLNTNSISTLGTAQNINVFTDPTSRVNFNTTVNVAQGNDLFVNGNLHVSGNSTFAVTNIVGSTGNFNINGNLTFSTTNQTFENLVPNSDFSISSTGFTGIGTMPQNWSYYVPGSNYAFGPAVSALSYLQTPASLNAQMAPLLITGSYSIEANINLFGNSLFNSFGDNNNQIWYKANSTPAWNTSFYVKANGALAVSGNGVELATPTGLIGLHQWYDVAYVWGGGKRQLYINGSGIVSDSIDGAFHAGVTSQNIGAITTNQRNINGLIDNLRIFNAAISVFGSGSSYNPSGNANLLGFWQFENTLADSSGYGNTLLSPAQPTSAVPYTDTRLGQVFSGTTQTYTSDTLPVGTSNSLYGVPHTTTWLLGSGVNINQTGVEIISPTLLKANTNYNISYFAKNINGANFGVDILLSGTNISGNALVSSINGPTQINNSDWLRYSANLMTPASGSNFSTIFDVVNFNATGTINPIFGLAAVQVSEGPAQIPYNQSSSLAPRSLMLIQPIPDTTTFLIPNTATFTPIPKYSGTFVTHGGIVEINAFIGGTFRYDQTASVQMLVDSIPVQIGSQGQSGGNPQTTAAIFPFNYTTVLNPGLHTLQFQGLGSNNGTNFTINGAVRGQMMSSFSVVEML